MCRGSGQKVQRILGVALLLVAGCAPSVQPTPATIPSAIFTPLPTSAPSPIPPPTITSIPVTSTPVDTNGHITAPDGYVELRRAPDLTAEVARLVNNLAPLTVNGRSPDGLWLQVTFPDGFTGWVQAGYVASSVEVTLWPVAGTEVAAVGTPSGPDGVVEPGINALRLRTDPTTSSTVQNYLIEFTELRIIGRTSDNKWLQVVTPDGEAGWVLSVYVEIHVNLDDVPVTGISSSVSFPHNAEVSEFGDHLRLRTQPGGGEIQANLDQFTPLNVIGRTADSQWLQVQTPDNGQGWVAADYVDLMVDVTTLSVTSQAVVEIAPPIEPGLSAYNGVISGISSTSRQIFQRGQQLGNKPNVFSKIGDSITVAPWFLGPLGENNYNLREYGYLQPVVNYFLQGDARGSNPFVNESLASANGSTTDGVLDPQYADRQWCRAGESQLVCEYRVVKPSVALIMFGTNDMIYVPLPEGFRERLNRIVDISIDMGVIPVLSTIPNRAGYDEKVKLVNQIIVETARNRGVPLWDYARVLQGLPNQGLAEDGVHPSMSPYNTSPADFTAQNLEYGYIVRNLTALQALDAIWRNVIAAQ